MGVPFAFLPETLIQKVSFDFLAKQFDSNSVHTIVGCLWIGRMVHYLYEMLE